MTVSRTVYLIALLCSLVAGKAFDYGEYYRQYYQKYYESQPAQRNFSPEPEKPKHAKEVELRMPGVAPQKQDTYLCTAMKVPADDDRFIVHYKPHAEQFTAHHMLLFGCDLPATESKYWNCGNMGAGVCGGDSEHIMYAWGRNAPELSMPAGVGFKIGKTSDIKYLILQVHYLHVDKFKDGKTKDKSGVTMMFTDEPQRYQAGIEVLINGWSKIPPHQPKWHLDTACTYSRGPIMHPFAFRVHAHTLGVVVTGYRIRNGQWTLIGKGDPQRPQAFYPTARDADLDIEHGDMLAARCTYNSMNRDRITNIGATHNDEMCNFYMMYYYDPAQKEQVPSEGCDPFDETKISAFFPSDSDTPLETGPPRGGLLKRETTEDPGPCNPLKDECILDIRRIRRDLKLHEVENWPARLLDDKHQEILLGQVSGVDVDTSGNVVVFHRAGRGWEPGTFDLRDNFLHPEVGAIPQNTLMWLEPKTGKILMQAGANRFYLPHGLTVDHENNLWLTDVAMHQVFKYKPDQLERPALTLGEFMVPGKDNEHFCKPTSVAVDSKTGNFFVADGYCNSRIMKFSPTGKLLLKIDSESLLKNPHFPRPASFLVPHSLSLDQEKGVLFLADRENGRILAFDGDTGNFLAKLDGFGARVFAVHYSPTNGGVLHIVNGADGSRVKGFTVSLSSMAILQSWWPKQGFNEPHDVTCSKDGSAVYVAEIIPNKIWKFASN